jgi:hypothetical protein
VGPSEVVTLHWIQEKPTRFRDRYGVWDPVDAKWCIYPNRQITPIERRIAPIRKGYGDDEQEAETFFARDYGRLEHYDDTALEHGLPHVLSQLEPLGDEFELSVEGGWHTHTDVAYYTPHLRHVEVDARVPEATGKRYVYGFFSQPPVLPLHGKATWDGVNAVWAYDLVDGRVDACAFDAECDWACSERERDEALVALDSE